MTPVGYLISLSVRDFDREAMLAVQKITRQGQVLFGLTKEAVSTHLYVIPANKNSAPELTSQLQAVPGFSQVHVVAFSNPIKETELSEVRKIFAGVDINASSVSDDELSLFIDSKLQGQYTYYIHLDHKPNKKGLFDMHIKLLTEHPQYSPDWIKDTVRTKKEKQDTEQPFDDIETHVDVVIQTVEVDEPPPPPPPPPNNLDQMTDAQIRHWMKKNDSRDLEDKDIDIKRTSEEVVITIELDGVTEALHYKLKK